jgi:hypothetical protein
MPLSDQHAEDGVTVKQSMRELSETFVYCFTMELNRLSQAGPENAVAVLERWQHLVGRRKPYFMFGPTQLNEMAAILFGDTNLSSDTLTDFVMSLTVSLQAHLVRNDQNVMDLCRDLSESLILLEAGTPVEANATADIFSERLSSQETILKTLKANRWLLTILLGALFVPEIIDATQKALRTNSGKKPQEPMK